MLLWICFLIEGGCSGDYDIILTSLLHGKRPGATALIVVRRTGMYTNTARVLVTHRDQISRLNFSFVLVDTGPILC